MKLRTDQERSIRGAHDCLAKCKSQVVPLSVLLVAPTGFGKTVMLSELARRVLERGKRVAWYAHRRELVTQAAKTLQRFGLEVGYNGIGRGAPIQIATVQSVLASGEAPPGDVGILDEAHHYVSAEWSRLTTIYAERILVGATATPERSDGLGLSPLFRSIVVCAQISDLQKSGTLVALDVRRPSRPLRNNQIAQRPVDAYLEHAAGERAVVFAQTVQRAREFCDEFNAAGVKAECVFGETATEERDGALARFERGDTRVLCNVAVLTEGWDCPPASCCILARGIGSIGLLVQTAGRVLRAHCTCGKANTGVPCSCAKPGATLLDLRGVTYALGRPDEDRDFSLEGFGMAGRGEGNAVRFCRVCGGILGDEGSCECSRVAADVGAIEVVNERLVFWKEEIRRDDRGTREWRLCKWVGDLLVKGKDPKGAKFKFKAVYGYFPTDAQIAMAVKKQAPSVEERRSSAGPLFSAPGRRAS